MKEALLLFCDDYSFQDEKYLHLLPEKRLEQYHRLKDEKAKKNCILAYLLLSAGLKKNGVAKFDLSYSENEKPYIKNSEIFFNISHTDNGVACAFDSREIGVDIQALKLPSERLLKKACSEQELEIILKQGDISKSFTKLWTFKESIIKKRGGRLMDYSKYEFDQLQSDFYKYGEHFVCFEIENKIITACGSFEKLKLKKIKDAQSL